MNRLAREYTCFFIRNSGAASYCISRRSELDGVDSSMAVDHNASRFVPVPGCPVRPFYLPLRLLSTEKRGVRFICIVAIVRGTRRFRSGGTALFLSSISTNERI